MNKALFLVPIFCQLLWVFSGPLMAEEIAIQLEPATQGRYRQALDPIRIRLPAGIDTRYLQSLIVELDGIDVTAMLNRNGDVLHYTPIRALLPGQHELRVVAYEANGNINEVAFWSLTIRQPPRLASQMNINLNQRVSDKNIQNGIDAFSAQGSAAFQGAFDHGQLASQGYLNLFYISNKALSPTGKKLEMADFLLKANTENTALQIGHQVFGQRSLLSDGYQKRGLAVSANLDSLNSKVSIFTMNSNDILGFSEGLGISDKNNRITGTNWNFIATQTETSEVSMSSSYIKGRDSQASFATIETTQQSAANNGEAWNAVIDGNFFSRQLRVRWEKAESRYDFTGLSTDVEQKKDGAYSAFIMYSPTPSQTAESPTVWRIGAEVTRVGRFYHSLANEPLPADRHLKRLFTSVRLNKFTVDMSYGEEENNLAEDVTLAKTETNQTIINFGYSDYSALNTEGVFQWLGAPVLGLQLSQTLVEDLFTPFGAIIQDTETQSFIGNVGFIHNTWNWSLNYRYQTFDDFADWQIDTQTSAILLQANMTLSRHLSFNSSVQQQRTLNLDFGTTSRANIYALGSRYSLWKDRIIGNLNLSFSENKASNDPFFAQDDKTFYGGGQITWVAKLPQQGKLGFNVSLSFNTQDFDSRLYTANNIHTNQVFLSISSTTSLGGL